MCAHFLIMCKQHGRFAHFACVRMHRQRSHLQKHILCWIIVKVTRILRTSASFPQDLRTRFVPGCRKTNRGDAKRRWVSRSSMWKLHDHIRAARVRRRTETETNTRTADREKCRQAVHRAKTRQNATFLTYMAGRSESVQKDLQPGIKPSHWSHGFPVRRAKGGREGSSPHPFSQ